MRSHDVCRPARHPPPRTDAASVGAPPVRHRFTKSVSTPLAADGRPLLLSDHVMLKLARSSDMCDRVARKLPSLVHTPGRGLSPPPRWPPSSWSAQPATAHESPPRPERGGLRAAREWESGRRLGDDQGNRAGTTASFRKLPGDPASGNQRPNRPVNPQIQPHEATENPG